ncbi:phytoene/squalene synthase family protein [Aerococcaceae bacterium DSM 111176]|nr:phytoene/squalene synthase family protein [Aerococcaceae bacterium DSM 111176]
MIGKNKINPDFQKHKADFTYCEKIIKKHSKTFYAAFSTLPDQEAMAVYAIYAFCRKADDIVDEEMNEAGLKKLHQQLELFEKGEEPDHPIWRALRVVFDTYKMDIAPFYDMITGQKMDLSFQQPETQKDLENYSYYVAGSVGLMMLPLLTDKPEDYQKHAIALGTAMQITNILRDIGEDLENGRVYLPKAMMEKYGYTFEMLESKTINTNFIDLWEYEAKQAEDYYQESLNLVYNMNKEAKKPLLLSILLYREILNAVRLNDYQCFNKRNAVSKRRKVELLRQADEMLKK